MLPASIKSVSILTISDQNGCHVELHKDEDSAKYGLACYVQDNWSSELPNTKQPDNIGEAIEVYFDAMHLDWYQIDTKPVPNTPPPHIFIRVEGGIIQGWSATSKVLIEVYDADLPESERLWESWEWQQQIDRCQHHG